MKVSRANFPVVIICFFLTSTGHADLWTGNELVVEMEEFKEAIGVKSDNNANFILATSFASCVYAVYDVMQMDNKLYPHESVTDDQVIAVVIKWVDDNLKRRHKPAVVLISQTLSDGFVCYT